MGVFYSDACKQSRLSVPIKMLLKLMAGGVVGLTFVIGFWQPGNGLLQPSLGLVGVGLMRMASR